jgi:endonuclease G
VLVPTSTWKAVYDPAVQGAAAYQCPNVSPPKGTTLSSAALARETGIDPFPAVSEGIKQIALTLPPPEPSPYATHRHQRGQHHPHQPDLFAPLFSCPETLS